jgi:hypothetical protein
MLRSHAMLRRFALVLATTTVGCFSPESARTSADEGGTATDTDTTTTAPTTTDVPTTTATTASSTMTSSMTTTAPTSTDPDDTGPADTTESADTTDTMTTGPTARCGDGDFEPGELCWEDAALLDIEVAAVDVALGIVDDDQVLDLAVAGGSSVAVRPGDGAGGFGNISSYSSTGTTVAVGAGDFDDDGFGDMVALSQPLAIVNSWSGGFDYLERPGNGQFVDAYNDLVVGDFDGGDLDIVYTSAYAAVFQHGFVNGFTWDYEAPVAIPLPGGEGAAGIAAAAFVFDGDADLDVAVVNRYTTTADILVGNDFDGTFALHASVQVCPDGVNGARHVAIGDIDGDGYQDLVVTCEPDQLTVTLANDDGTFAAPVAYELTDGFDLALGNVDDDGELDVVVATPSTGTVHVMRESGGGALELGIALEVGEPIGGVTLGDVDSDGALDILVAVPSGAVAFFRSNP